MIKAFVFLFIIIFSITSGFTQDSFSKKKVVQNEKQPVKLMKGINNFSKTPENIHTPQELDIISEMNQIKQPESNIIGGERILELQKRLEATNSSTITKQETNPMGRLIPGSIYNSGGTDNLNVSDIINNYNSPVGIAVQVEQRGATAGKIWIALALVNGDTGMLARPDTLAIYYSVNNGASYNLHAVVPFSGHNKFISNDIDMEIIENTTGTKYLHVVFGYVTNGHYGQRLIGYTIISAPTPTYSGSTLIFPGYNLTSQYTQARITSDNARYPGNPYITIAVTQDSISGGLSYFLSKTCRVLSPFTISPSITYFPRSIYAPVAGFSNYDVVTDVANYHNGNDSLIFILSNYPGFNDRIYFYKAFSNSTVYPTANGSVSPSGNNLEYARIAANGGTNQIKLMITYSDNNNGDFDQWILTTEDASNWSSTALDNTSYNNSKFGDVIGRRNADGSFEVAFKNAFGYMENVGTYSFTDFAVTSLLHSVNTNYGNSYASPKPAFRYIPGDSCMTVWSDFYTTHSTGGCVTSNLYVKVGLEGFLNEVTSEHSQYVHINVLLANPLPPYNILDTGLTYLEYQRLENVVAFPRALTGNFYLVVKNFNSLETWSAAPVYVSPSNPEFYDFTDSDSKAYGNNMVFKGSVWCIYSGDVDQDGSIDGTDTQIIDNDAYNFVTGMSYVSDLNGDYFVDGTDMLICDNNVTNFVSTVRP